MSSYYGLLLNMAIRPFGEEKFRWIDVWCLKLEWFVRVDWRSWRSGSRGGKSRWIEVSVTEWGVQIILHVLIKLWHSP
jgi:hypothetical protein